MRLHRFGREEFLSERWDYRPGEHVSIIAPTQNGKTTFIFSLLSHTDLSWCSVPPVMLVAKPRDPVVANGLESLQWTETDKWPPKRSLFGQPAKVDHGYGLWPRHLKDGTPAANNAHLAETFRKAMRELFWKGDTVCIADEVYWLSVPLGLSEELTAHWSQGAGMGAGLWSATQKPSGTQAGSIPTFFYNSATHTFLGRDPDKRNRDRFAEIGGVDPKAVGDAVMSLKKYEWLYIHRDGPSMCVIEAS